jgi:hypothetical protein
MNFKRTKIDLIGKKIGRLTVINVSHIDKRKAAHWLCICECGNTITVRRNSLLSNATVSCGCYNRDIKRELIKKRNDATRLPPGESNFNIVFNRYKRKSEKNKITFELTKEQSKNLMELNCHYCGCLPMQIENMKNTNGAFIYNGIDRKNSDMGYNIQNCVSCCGECNWVKSSMPYNRFLLKMMQIANHCGVKLYEKT